MIDMASYSPFTVSITDMSIHSDILIAIKNYVYPVQVSELSTCTDTHINQNPGLTGGFVMVAKNVIGCLLRS